MKTKYVLSFIVLLLLFFSCSRRSQTNYSKNEEHNISVRVNIDGRDLDQNELDEKVSFTYLTYLNPDTTYLQMNNGEFTAPKFDTLMTYFKIDCAGYTADFKGGTLDLVLASMLSEEITRWEIEIDTPPFNTKNSKRNKSNSIEYILFLRQMKGDFTRGSWTHIEKKVN